MGISGLTPEQWEQRLAEAADDEDALAQVLAELEREMGRESHWVHDNPELSNVIARVLEFFGREDDDDVAALGRQIKEELQAERRIHERYRSWIPGENFREVLFPYLKSFGEPVVPDSSGPQFPGYLRYKGVRRGRTSEMWVFYISQRFPGRDPANFHVAFDRVTGKLIVKRAYKKELPRIEGITTVGRAVLAGMMRELVSDLAAVRVIAVDNAANHATREALLVSRTSGTGVTYAIRPGADAKRTPLGHLMYALAVELGLRPGAFRLLVGPFGTLRLALDVCG